MGINLKLGLLKKIFARKKQIGEKRASPRKQLEEHFTVQLSINGTKYRIHDFSSSGIGLFNEGRKDLKVGGTYSAELVAYGQPKCTVKLEVVRRGVLLYGCKILSPEIFKSFEQDYLRLQEKT